MTRCEKCAWKAEDKEVFVSRSRHFGGTTFLVCPDCARHPDRRTYWLALATVTAFLVSGVVMTWLAPALSIGVWLLNLTTVTVFILPSTILHELGHAVAGRLAGYRILGIDIGHGERLYEIRIAKLWIRLHSILAGGVAYGILSDVKQYRLRRTVFIFGGPAADLLLIGLALMASPWDDSFSGPWEGFAPMHALLLSNLVLFSFSAWPYRFRSKRNGSMLDNDSLLLWNTWRQPVPDITHLKASWFHQEAVECYEVGDYQGSHRWTEEGLWSFPDALNLQYLQACNLMQLGQYELSRNIFKRLLVKYAGQRSVQITLVNNIAYIEACSGSTGRLSEAERYSRAAYTRFPKNTYFKGTRGSVLAKLGRIDEALNLLREAIKEHQDRHSKADIACFIGMSYVTARNPEEGKRFFTLARRLDPGCSLLEKECVA